MTAAHGIDGVYKIGMSLYAGGVDKNSGLFEAKIIRTEFARAFSNIKRAADTGILIIINGALRENEEVNVLRMIDRHRKVFGLRSKIIFIMSDSIALKTCANVIKECDYLFHQAPFHMFTEFNIKQMYGYVPELFYKYNLNQDTSHAYDDYDFRRDRVLFGGNNLNRQDKFDAYLNCGRCDVLKKDYNTGVDERIPYMQYLAVLKEYKYSLMICREEYREIGWLTARLFECLANFVLPIFDVDYDKDRIFAIPDLICRDANDMVYAMDNYRDKEKVFKTLLQMREEVKSNGFRQLLQRIERGEHL